MVTPPSWRRLLNSLPKLGSLTILNLIKLITESLREVLSLSLWETNDWALLLSDAAFILHVAVVKLVPDSLIEAISLNWGEANTWVFLFRDATFCLLLRAAVGKLVPDSFLEAVLLSWFGTNVLTLTYPYFSFTCIYWLFYHHITHCISSDGTFLLVVTRLQRSILHIVENIMAIFTKDNITCHAQFGCLSTLPTIITFAIHVSS